MRILDHFGNLESIFNLFFWTSGDGLLNEHGNSREVLQDLQFDVSAWAQAPAEHGRASDDNSAGSVLWRHVANKVFEGFEDTSVLVC
jgi:hypothetical protein